MIELQMVQIENHKSYVHARPADHYCHVVERAKLEQITRINQCDLPQLRFTNMVASLSTQIAIHHKTQQKALGFCFIINLPALSDRIQK
jgi:hypothetical protein